MVLEKLLTDLKTCYAPGTNPIFSMPLGLNCVSSRLYTSLVHIHTHHVGHS